MLQTLIAGMHFVLVVTAAVYLHQALLLGLRELLIVSLSWFSQRQVHAVVGLLNWIDVCSHANVVVLN